MGVLNSYKIRHEKEVEMGLFQTLSLSQLSQCWFRHLKSVCCDCFDFPVLQVLLVVSSVVVLWCSALLYLHISVVGISESQHCQLANLA